MTTGLYVFGEYVQRLQTLFQQNRLNVSFRETVRLIASNHFALKNRKQNIYPIGICDEGVGLVGV